MSNGNTTNNPSPWDILNDYTKTVITLASALLGLTITFSGQIIGEGVGDIQRWLLIGAWLALVVTILAGVLAEAFLTTFLRGKSANCNACLFWSTVALWSLLGAAVLFVVCAVTQLNQKKVGFTEVTQKSVKTVAAIAAIPNAKWQVISVSKDSVTEKFTIQVLEETTKSTYKITSDGKTGDVLSQERIAPN